jgi:hypothetical protein
MTNIAQIHAHHGQRRHDSTIRQGPIHSRVRPGATANLITPPKPPENGGFFPFSKSFSFFCNSALADFGNHC